MNLPEPQSSPDAAALNERALADVIADGARARRQARQALELAGGDRVQEAMAHATLAVIAFREGTTDEGALHLRQAQERVAGAAESRAGWLAEHARALQLRRLGELGQALQVLRSLHERAGAQRPLVDAYLTLAALGVVLGMEGDNEGALASFYEALALARRSGVPSLVANALNNLGSFQSDLYNLEDARPLLEECLQNALRLGSRRQIIYAAGNLVQCLCLMGQAREALAIAREQLVARIRPDDLPALQRDEEIAQALLDNGLIDEAEARLGGQQHVDTMSNEMATARVWLAARIQIARGRPAQALALCLARQALQGEDDSTLAFDRVQLARVAGEAAAAVGDHAGAYAQLREAFATHELLLGRAARARFLSLQIAHRVQQAERERDSAREQATRVEALNASLQAQIVENERLQERLRAQALEDPLTGLHNRRYLFEAGSALLALARRRGTALAVALVDLDHFKQVNDRHGHDAGDQVLRAFGQLARRALRASDIVCRYGGEEFVLLFVDADAEQARLRLDQLLQAFVAMRFEDGTAQGFACSFSAGIATRLDADERIEPLLQRADAALYGAKGAGRGRVVLQRPIASSAPAGR